MQLRTIGIDLAKSVFQLHGVDAQGAGGAAQAAEAGEGAAVSGESAALRGGEACGSVHYWAREIQKLGHEVKLINPQFVRAYVKSNKSDPNDAEGISEAVSRPAMRFVPVKTMEQQDLLALRF